MLTPGDPKFPTSCRGEFCVKSSSAQQPMARDAVDSCLRFAWQAPHSVTLGPPPLLPVPASELHQSKVPAWESGSLRKAGKVCSPEVQGRQCWR